jgi:ElaB/YqjD/DUF883 family membrane-anchored ribosome-binding protein
MMTDQAGSRASGKVGDALGAVKEKTTAAYTGSRDKAGEALETARAKASLTARRAAEGIEENPIAALVGGLALGAIAGVLLPASRKESELLAPIGSKVGEAAKIATQAAREAGQAKLDELGLSRERAREQVGKLVDNAVKVAGEASGAAARSVRQGEGGSRPKA